MLHRVEGYLGAEELYVILEGKLGDYDLQELVLVFVLYVRGNMLGLGVTRNST